MDKFIPCHLSRAGLPPLQADEIELKNQDGVSITLVDKTILVSKTLMILTNFRFIFICAETSNYSSDRLCMSCLLSLVESIESCPPKFMIPSKRLQIQFTDQTFLHFKFSAGGKDEFLSEASEAMIKKGWAKKELVPIGFSSSDAGIGGLIRRQKRDIATVESLQHQALSDLDHLMSSAKEVVGIIERFTKYTKCLVQLNCAKHLRTTIVQVYGTY